VSRHIKTLPGAEPVSPKLQPTNYLPIAICLGYLDSPEPACRIFVHYHAVDLSAQLERPPFGNDRVIDPEIPALNVACLGRSIPLLGVGEVYRV
jgi:hypothetical protein